jgi:hypothetical protein
MIDRAQGFTIVRTFDATPEEVWADSLGMHIKSRTGR